MKIYIHRDPHPESLEPAYVKRAYAGLVLEVDSVHLEPVEEWFPNGFYFVTPTELLQKMAQHNREAYLWLARMWGPVQDAVEGEAKIRLPFPVECCEPIEAVH